MHTVESLRKAFRKQCAKTAGEDGEEYAEKWLSQSGWNYLKVEQGKNNLSKELKEYGGKRPDFIVDPRDNGSWLLIDAKYHSTENCTTFKLKDSEIAKYRGLVQFCVEKFPEASLDMVFMVFPKECDGNKFVWVHLDEFDKGENLRGQALRFTRVFCKHIKAPAPSILGQSSAEEPSRLPPLCSTNRHKKRSIAQYHIAG
jgi:hypothetical protein